MDVLIKNNIIKKNKMIVDIGTFATKVMEVHYAAKKITIMSARTIDNRQVMDNGEINYNELARKIYMEKRGTGKKDVSISLPANLCENKIINIKNKKESEIQKIIKKDHLNFGKANPLTHVIDYAFLGKREEQGDTVFYFLITAVQKSVVNEIIAAFNEYKMKIKTIVSSVYNQICLSKLFFDDYENLNRLFIDFGTRTTRITAFAEGCGVYTRNLDFGFNQIIEKLFQTQSLANKPEVVSAVNKVGYYMLEDTKGYECFNVGAYNNTIEDVSAELFKEIRRVIDLCESNDTEISKIYITGFVMPKMAEKIGEETGVKAQQVKFGVFDDKTGDGYILEIDDTQLGAEYSNALGLAIYPML